MNQISGYPLVPSNLIAAQFQNLEASYRPWLHLSILKQR